MFQPNYQLNPLILSNITQIDRFYGQLEGLRLPKKLELNLESKNLIQSSYVSNSIEGNPLSLLEVTNLLLGDRVAVNRDEKEIINYFNILSNLTFDRPLNLKTILEIHKDLMKGVEDNIAGQIRDKRIVVGKYVEKEGKVDVKVKHEPPFHSKLKIEIALEDLLQWLDSNDKMPISLKAGIFHHQFVYIHPFEDGNGRISRFWQTLFLSENNKIFEFLPIESFIRSRQADYYEYLNLAQKSDDPTGFVVFLVSIIRDSLLEGLRYSYERPTDGKQDSRLAQAKVHFKNTYFSRKDYMMIHPTISDSMATKDLKYGVNEGLLDRLGSNNGTKYKF